MDLSCPEVYEVKLTDTSKSHLFRHASEITKETKGGYLKGRITVPKSRSHPAAEPVFFRLSVVPAQIDMDGNGFHLHPNLLHINTRCNKKNRNLVNGQLPDDVDWSFLFKIQEGAVFRVCPPPPTSAHRKPRFHLNTENPVQDPRAKDNEAKWREEIKDRLEKSQNMEEPLTLGNVEPPLNHTLSQLCSLKNGQIEMNNSGLMLNIITPLQKFSKGGTTIRDVIRQRYQDLFGFHIPKETCDEIEEYYTKDKKERIKLQQVRLLMEVFDENLRFKTSTLSEVITNSKSKECGPLELHDVNPAVSCCQSESKIFLLSFFKLVADVRANFLLYDPIEETVVYDRHLDLMTKINHPKECAVFNQTALIFKAPKQDYAVIKKIKDEGLQLRIAAFRPHDKRMSTNSFEFTYLEHKRSLASQFPKIYLEADPNDTCAFCSLFANPSQMTTGKQLPLAKPGVQRRAGEPQEVPKKIAEQFQSQNYNEDKKEKVVPLEPNHSHQNKPEVSGLRLRPTRDLLEKKAEDSSLAPRSHLLVPTIPVNNQKRPYKELEVLRTGQHSYTVVHTDNLVEMKVEPDQIMEIKRPRMTPIDLSK